jgi:hypothetical protein
LHDRLLFHQGDGFRGGRSPARGAVGSDCVLVSSPLFDDDPGLLQSVEDLAVEPLDHFRV